MEQKNTATKRVAERERTQSLTQKGAHTELKVAMMQLHSAISAADLYLNLKDVPDEDRRRDKVGQAMDLMDEALEGLSQALGWDFLAEAIYKN